MEQSSIITSNSNLFKFPTICCCVVEDILHREQFAERLYNTQTSENENEQKEVAT